MSRAIGYVRFGDAPGTEFKRLVRPAALLLVDGLRMLHNNLQTTLGWDVDRLEAHRHFYAELVTTSGRGPTKNSLGVDANAS